MASVVNLRMVAKSHDTEYMRDKKSTRETFPAWKASLLQHDLTEIPLGLLLISFSYILFLSLKCWVMVCILFKNKNWEIL